MRIGKSTDKYIRKQNRRVGIGEIAQKAGVSRTTVSNVLNGKKDKMSKETWRRIEKIIKEENYIPDINAKHLVSEKSDILGVFIRPVCDEFQRDFCLSRVLRIVEETVAEKNYFTFLHFTNDRDEIIQLSVMWKMRGILTIGYDRQTNQIIEEETQIPLQGMNVEGLYEESNYSKVKGKCEEGCVEGEFYLGKGIRKLHYFTDIEQGKLSDRWDGIVQSYCKKGVYKMGRKCSWISKDYTKRKNFYKEKLASLAFHNDLLIFENDFLAREALIYLDAMQIRVPEDVRVTGFDDGRYAMYTITNFLKRL